MFTGGNNHLPHINGKYVMDGWCCSVTMCLSFLCGGKEEQRGSRRGWEHWNELENTQRPRHATQWSDVWRMFQWANRSSENNSTRRYQRKTSPHSLRDSRLPPKCPIVLETHPTHPAPPPPPMPLSRHVIKIMSVYLQQWCQQVPHISAGVILDVCLQVTLVHCKSQTQ